MTTIINNRSFINNVCRLCLKQGNGMISIFDEIDEENHVSVLAEKITSIAQVEINPTDGLPISICHMCRRQVNQFHEFRLLVEMSDKALRSYLKSAQLQDQEKEIETNLFKNIVDDDFKDIMTNGNDEFSMKDTMSYALLVPTNEGLQIWKIDEIDQNPDETKQNHHQQKKINEDSKKDQIQLSQPCDYLRAYVTEEIAADDQFLNNMTSCQLCLREFSSLEDLKSHITEHCLPSENESPDQENLLDNQLTIPLNLTSDQNDKICSEALGVPPKKVKKVRLFKCRYCKKSFSRIPLKKHYEKCPLKVLQFVCGECGEIFTKRSDLRYHKGTHQTDPLSCATCNKLFRNLQSFKMHMKRHTLGSRYTCETCGQSYFTNSELARHVQKHEEKRKYPCHLCETSFMSKPELNRHMKYHNGVKKFECNLCCKSYYESGHLKVHKRVHTGERPFVCELCDKGFVTRSKLLRHSKIHQKEGDVFR